MEIFEKLGIEPQLLIAQAVNFFLLLFVLYKFLYGPVLKMLNSRTEKVEKSLKDAEEIEKRLLKTEEETKKIIENAKNEAKGIIAEADKSGREAKDAILADAEAKSQEIIENTNDQVRKEKDIMMNEIKKDLGSIVSASLIAIAQKEAGKIDKSLIDEAIQMATKDEKEKV